MLIITRLHTGFKREMRLEKNQDPSKAKKEGAQTLRNEGNPFFITEGAEEK